MGMCVVVCVQFLTFTILGISSQCKTASAAAVNPAVLRHTQLGAASIPLLTGVHHWHKHKHTIRKLKDRSTQQGTLWPYWLPPKNSSHFWPQTDGLNLPHASFYRFSRLCEWVRTGVVIFDLKIHCRRTNLNSFSWLFPKLLVTLFPFPTLHTVSNHKRAVRCIVVQQQKPLKSDLLSCSSILT